ncbi:MAG TPA: hypothetical protein VGR72_04925 [Candidatus Acidoferrales bacterium]|nr:hypothetical protein [Candidatus Acidoferrales bacterium]
MEDLAPVREPALAEAGAAEAALPLRATLGVALTADGVSCESIVRSASRTKSNEEPHFKQLDDSASFSVWQWGQIIGWACFPSNGNRWPDYGLQNLPLQPSVGYPTVYGWPAVSRV